LTRRGFRPLGGDFQTRSGDQGPGQRVVDAGAHPDHRRLLDAEAHGDRIGGLEATDVMAIARGRGLKQLQAGAGVTAVTF
jgi:hypothetical protein